MDISTLKYYKIIGAMQSAISKAKTFNDALKIGLNEIISNTASDYAVLWYLNEKDGKLHPYYWVCPVDITSVSYEKGKGIVGRVYSQKKVESVLDFKNNPEEHLAEVFKGIDVSSVLCVPFSNNQIDLGCIEFIKVGTKFTDEEMDVCQILGLLTELSINENAPTLNSWQDKEKVLCVKNIYKDFKNGNITTKVLKGVNFDVFKGEFLCFLGESGCGKSTILNIIGGMDKATKGTFTFLGTDYSKANEKELTKYRRENIGFIFQSYNLMPNLTAKQNLDLIGELVENPMDSMEALKLVKMQDKANNYPFELSGGQQQRVSIARALIKRPKIIMADEPTAALDYATSIEVLSALENVIASGTTLVMVTHNEEITKMANRVIRFRNGKTYEVTVNNHLAKAKDLVW